MSIRRTPGIRRFFAVLLLTGLSAGASAPASGSNENARPAEFYIVSEVVSDAAPFWYHYILAVAPGDRGSLVRYIRVAPMGPLCAESITVKAATARLPDISPGELAAAYNLCSTDSAAFAPPIPPHCRANWRKRHIPRQ